MITLLLMKRRVNGPSTGEAVLKKGCRGSEVSQNSSLLYENDKDTEREVF